LSLKLKLPFEFVSCKSLTGDRTDNNFLNLKKQISNAIKKSPCILFIDDLEILFPKEQEEMPDLNVRVLSSLFVELLNQVPSDVKIIATCNQFDDTHGIIQQSNIFEDKIHLSLPIKEERKAILSFLTNSLNPELLNRMVIETENYTPLDLKNLVDKMINHALIHSEVEITLSNFEKISKEFSIQSTIGTKLLKSDTSWEDIGGLNEVKNTLIETFEIPIKYSKLFQNTPLKLRSGLLIYGFPGAGKTLLASAVSKECGLNFLTVKGPEVLNKYIGASEQAVRSIFEKAEAAKPCIIFFDEFDSIAAERGKDNTGVTDRVVNQLLVQLDGVESREGVYVLAATSRPDLIDPALLRPGRLDKSLFCGLPDENERIDILKKLSRDCLFHEDVNLGDIAKRCENFTGADLNALLYTAHLESTQDLIENYKKVDKVEIPITTFGEERFVNMENLMDNLKLEDSKEEKVKIYIEMKHFEIALKKTQPSLSEDEIMKYEYFYENFTNGKKSQEKRVTLM
jgi:peroxin-1